MSTMQKSTRATTRGTYSSRSSSSLDTITTKRSYSMHSSYCGVSSRTALGGFRGVGGSVTGLYDGDLNYAYRVGAGTNVLPLVTAVTINQSLLAPLNVKIDPELQARKHQEKEQIKTLNNRFASFIDKVCFLEQQNKLLETKWSLLQEKTTSDSSIKAIFNAYIANLRRQLEGLGNKKLQLESDLQNSQLMVEDFKSKYEEEIDTRNKSEYNFVLIKKDTDEAFLTRVELEAQRNSLADEFEFIKLIYDAEKHELQSSIKDTSVIVEMDNSRNLDLNAIVDDVRAEYEEIVNRSRAEAESFYRQKYEEMQVTATTRNENLRVNKAEIAEYSRKIKTIQNEIDHVKGLYSNQEAKIKKAEEKGKAAVKEAKLRVQELEEALKQAKRDMARQVREYQSLINIKLALDIEIATYRKLLEGEERSLRRGIKAVCISRQTSLVSEAIESSIISSHASASSKKRFSITQEWAEDSTSTESDICVAVNNTHQLYDPSSSILGL